MSMGKIERIIDDGHDIRAELIQPTEAQLDALGQTVRRLLVRHYGQLIAYGAGWTDPERQRPVGDTGRYEHADAIIGAELERALADPDPLRGIAATSPRRTRPSPGEYGRAAFGSPMRVLFSRRDAGSVRLGERPAKRGLRGLGVACDGPGAAGRARGDEQGGDRLTRVDVVRAFRGFAAGRRAIASVAKRSSGVGTGGPLLRRLSARPPDRRSDDRSDRASWPGTRRTSGEWLTRTPRPCAARGLGYLRAQA